MRYHLIWLSSAFFFSINPCADAQTSTARVRSDLNGQYELMKRTFLATLPGTTHGRPSPNQIYDMTDCLPGDAAYYARSKLVTGIGLLAVEVVTAQKMLQWLGYPSSQWEARLTNIEREQLSRIRDTGEFDKPLHARLTGALISALGEYRESSNRQLPKVEWETECGGGGISLQIVTRPEGGRVRYIPSLYYRFCNAQADNARHVKECDLWDEAADGEEVLFSGAYFFQLKPRGGAFGEARRKDFSQMSHATRWIVE